VTGAVQQEAAGALAAGPQAAQAAAAEAAGPQAAAAQAVGPQAAAAQAATAHAAGAGAAQAAEPQDASEWDAAVAALRGLAPGARVLLACHVNPDGDALGSMLGFGLGLRRLGIEAQASFPGPLEVPDVFRWMPGLDLLVSAEEADPAPDAMLAFDAASIERLGSLADRLTAAPVNIVLDHHLSNTYFGAINLVDPGAAATSVVCDGLLRRLGVPLDAEIAECLYVALATDTGSFKFASTTPAVHEFAARLIAAGVRTGEVSRRLFDARPFGAVRLFGEAMGRAVLEPAAAGGLGLVWTYATLADLDRYGQRPAVLEALIDSVRCVDEADVACVVKQVREEEWAISLRSKGQVDVSQVAVTLGGGGHRFAAGFTARGSVDEIMDRIRQQLG
jgi:phosphoesterase RecJ-like protein